MADKRSFFYEADTANYIVEFKGDFLGQMAKIDYAVGHTLARTVGIVAVKSSDVDRLLNDVPSIIYIGVRKMMVLQDIEPSDVGKINEIKINPYLNLTGNGVTVLIIDTGIDYLNEEFIREDGTSRILAIWDQNIRTEEESEGLYIGKVYRNEEINAAIKASKNNQNPYDIVPSKDERGHGTQVASIIGGRSSSHKGIAENCDFIVVKLMESPNLKAILKENNIGDVAVYNNSEFVASLEFARQEFYKLKNQAMVICPGVGGTEGSHDGGNLVTRYLNTIALVRGICIVAGVGNEGDKEGHTTGYLRYKNDVSVKELKVPREIAHLTVSIWLQKPNKASINIISPTGEESKVIKSKINKAEDFKFVFTNTEFTVSYRIPDNFTGNNAIRIDFRNIKEGIWKIQLVGEYVVGGRFDIWIPPRSVRPEGLVFLEPNPNNTLAIPSTAPNAVSVSYVGKNDSIVPSSGKGYTADSLIIKPDIAAEGENIITVNPNGGLTTISGSSAAAAVVAGACALLLQWGIINNNDPSTYSNKVRSYLVYGAYRNPMYKFPNTSMGYGIFNLLGVFNIIARLYNSGSREDNDNHDGYLEYSVQKMIVRIPIDLLGEGK